MNQRHHDHYTGDIEQGMEHRQLHRIVILGDTDVITNPFHRPHELTDEYDRYNTRGQVENQVRASQATPLQLPPPVPTVREALRAFAEALRQGAPMPISLEEGLRAVALAEACYRSSAAQTAVPVESP